MCLIKACARQRELQGEGEIQWISTRRGTNRGLQLHHLLLFAKERKPQAQNVITARDRHGAELESAPTCMMELITST